MEILLGVIVIATLAGLALWTRDSTKPEEDTVTERQTTRRARAEAASPRSEDDVLAATFSDALRLGITDGWVAAVTRFKDASSKFASRAILHFVIAGGLAALCVAVAEGYLVPRLSWLPPSGPIWFVASIGIPTAYFLIALALSTPRRRRLAVLDNASSEVLVRSLMGDHFDSYLEQHVSMRTRILDAALKDARSVAAEEGRHFGYDTARKELERAVEAAASEAYERGRQAGQVDKERAVDQAFERGFQVPRN